MRIARDPRRYVHARSKITKRQRNVEPDLAAKFETVRHSFRRRRTLDGHNLEHRRRTYGMKGRDVIILGFNAAAALSAFASAGFWFISGAGKMPKSDKTWGGFSIPATRSSLR